ncbi:MAG: DNA-binding protein [Candidatus Omnitrophica bacterium]|nr:DNA-binding protein [Candidatus Omnitrophota bacterium]MDD5500561.1 DNA-binding protein [Candidatus Omnitrophota bacterium]
MKKNQGICITLFFLLFFNCFIASANAAILSSRELIGNAVNYDGKTIVYSGEVIGDIMLRGEHAWVNISDGSNSIGVWMDARMAREIRFSGDYKNRGDKIEVIGVFHRACPEHGGDLDIHAKTIRRIEAGGPLKRDLQARKKNISIVLFGALILIWILTLFKRS